MAKFATISPTHIEGKKEYAWEKFRDGDYIAIGWMHTDLTGKSKEEIEEIVRAERYDNETSAVRSFERFMTLSPGDYVAVNNVNNGLFGVGVVKSDYTFKKYRHDSGAEKKDECYSHFRDVEWRQTSYVYRRDIVESSETSWEPYGTISSVHDEVPLYIRRLLGEDTASSGAQQESKIITPEYLGDVVEVITQLRNEEEHKERAHESLVEDFFCAIGYRKHKDIKFRRGRVDVNVTLDKKVALIVEVKPFWNMNLQTSIDAIKQAYGYAHEQGVRFVAVTNGDNYLFFDRLKGLDYESNLVGSFQLTRLDEDGLSVIERLKRERLTRPDVSETFKHIAKSFE